MLNPLSQAQIETITLWHLVQHSLAGFRKIQAHYPSLADALQAGQLLEAGNLLFMGTNVVSGSAMAVVVATGNQTYFGTLAARWGYGSQHDGAQYQVHLCETCFFEALANLRQAHRLQNLFAEDYQPADPDHFGRVEGNQELI